MRTSGLFTMQYIAIFILTIEVLIFAFVNIKISIALLPAILILIFDLNAKLKNKRIWPCFANDKVPKYTLWKKLFNSLPEGIAIVRTDKQKIIWQNKSFVDIFNTDKKKVSLPTLLDNDLIEDVFSGKVKEYEIKDKVYSVWSLDLNSKFKAILFSDVTQISKIKEKLSDEKTAILYIQIDDFDEVMSACPEENRPEIRAKIDKTITQWVNSYDGFIKKYQNDKFVAVLSVQKLKQAEDDKFSILEEIRQIKIAEAITVTLSIGISYGQPSILQNSKLAQDALELCLGRGGDQVVIKANNKTYFYGGTTKEVEKYSRVRARVIAHALKDLIAESDTVFILGHMFMDMDALGAALGIYRAVKSLAKPGYILTLPEQNFSVESFIELIKKNQEIDQIFITEETALNKLTQKSLVVIVDTHRPSLCLSQKILDRAERIVIIDHHRRSEEFIDKALLVYLEPYASSTSEMVTEMLQYMGDEIKLTPIEATALLAGIAVDTRNFVFKTGVRTFEAASYLRRFFANPMEVYKLFREDLKTVNERAEVIKRAWKITDNIAVSYYTEKPENPPLSAARAANSLLEIKGIDASFVLVRTDSGISISGRSLGEVNVQKIMEKLGGGGHMIIAGAQLEDVTMDEAIEKLNKAIFEYIKEGEKQ